MLGKRGETASTVPLEPPVMIASFPSSDLGAAPPIKFVDAVL